MSFSDGFASGMQSTMALMKAKRDKEKWDWEKQDRERAEGARKDWESKLQGAESMRDAENTIQSASDVSLTANKPIKLNANTDMSEDEKKRQGYADGGQVHVKTNSKLKCGQGKNVSPPTHFPGMRFHP